MVGVVDSVNVPLYGPFTLPSLLPDPPHGPIPTQGDAPRVGTLVLFGGIAAPGLHAGNGARE